MLSWGGFHVSGLCYPDLEERIHLPFITSYVPVLIPSDVIAFHVLSYLVSVCCGPAGGVLPAGGLAHAMIRRKKAAARPTPAHAFLQLGRVPRHAQICDRSAHDSLPFIKIDIET